MTAWFNVTRLVSCGIVFATIHMPAMFSYESSARGKLASPTTRIKERRHEGQTERECFKLVTAHETAAWIVPRLVLHDAGHGGAAPHLHGFIENAVNRACDMAHVVYAQPDPEELASPSGNIDEAEFSSRRGLSNELPRDANHFGLLHLQITVRIEILDAGDFTCLVMQNAGHVRQRAHFQIACRFALGNVGIGRPTIWHPICNLENRSRSADTSSGRGFRRN